MSGQTARSDLSRPCRQPDTVVPVRSEESDAIAAQGHATNVWLGGTDLAGQKIATTSAPTLIADGTTDRLDPVANDYALAQLTGRSSS